MREIISFIAISLLFVVDGAAAQQLVASKTEAPPLIDGLPDDPAWQVSPTLTTTDKVTQIPIKLQAVYTDEHIFIKARFTDQNENRDHKVLVWNGAEKVYRTSSKREDSFVIKWSMEPVKVDMSLESETPYKADVWFWKAFRTDPVGFADDKFHVFGAQKTKESRDILLPSGKTMYLTRSSDTGRSSYKSIAYEKFSGDEVPRYEHRHPEGSRADIKAKGGWADGFWTIEFKRALDTGHSDDIQLDPSLEYQFGVSRHEIAGKRPNPALEQPYYESGDVGEELTLVFR